MESCGKSDVGFAKVAPVIGRDGKLLGVSLNGVVCVRPDDNQNVSLEEWATSLLYRAIDAAAKEHVFTKQRYANYASAKLDDGSYYNRW